MRTSTCSPTRSATARASSSPSWRASPRLQLKARELGIELDGPTLDEIVDTLKRLEHEGYHFEAADGSLELLMRRAAGWEQDYFRVESFRVITDETEERALHHRSHHQGARRRRARGDRRPRATVRSTRSTRHCDSPSATSIRRSSTCTSPTTRSACSTPRRAPAPSPRVLIDSTDGERTWSTIGVSENIIEASWQALSIRSSTACCTRPRRCTRQA